MTFQDSAIPAASIILPALGRAPLLVEVLRSIAAQQGVTFEAVVVEDGDDGGAIQAACLDYPFVRYFQRRRAGGYRNKAVPCNIGIRQARAPLLVLMDADVRFTHPDSLRRLLQPHTDTGTVRVAMAPCRALDRDGRPDGWRLREGMHPLLGTGASMPRQLAIELGGFDEGFSFWGGEDFDLLFRLQLCGAELVTLSEELLVTEHLWHEREPEPWGQPGRVLYEKNKTEISNGERSIIANTGTEWGKLE
jgi:glycosyltransferase involved in cell wall biosynthesis